MTTTSFVILHGGTGIGLHLIEYVRRVGLTLTFLGGGAVLAYSGLEVGAAIRAAVLERRNRREHSR